MPTELDKELHRVAIFRAPFWAYRWTLFWAVLSTIVFGGTYAFGAINEIPEAHQILMFVFLATILIITAVWQSTGLALARLETLILLRRTPG
jgi:Zn-dependent protease